MTTKEIMERFRDRFGITTPGAGVYFPKLDADEVINFFVPFLETQKETISRKGED